MTISYLPAHRPLHHASAAEAVPEVSQPYRSAVHAHFYGERVVYAFIEYICYTRIYVCIYVFLCVHAFLWTCRGMVCRVFVRVVGRFWYR